ncbi:MAG: periplasmic heavy metal sensor [Verrucomicrobiae bacterium]|nr:periplasmic heavy metal sensor [Verrucomicrobiae bacterium]
MRRTLPILILGLLGAVGTYCLAYFAGTFSSRALLHSPQPELAWLQHEFKLTGQDLARITELHAGYLPRCMERCARIDELNTLLAAALHADMPVPAEIDSLLRERADMRVLCQSEMIDHFLQVSRTMPPDQGRRYLAWVWDNTSLRERPMDHSFRDATAIHTPGPMD